VASAARPTGEEQVRKRTGWRCWFARRGGRRIGHSPRAKEGRKIWAEFERDRKREAQQTHDGAERPRQQSQPTRSRCLHKKNPSARKHPVRNDKADFSWLEYCQQFRCRQRFTEDLINRSVKTSDFHAFCVNFTQAGAGSAGDWLTDRPNQGAVAATHNREILLLITVNLTNEQMLVSLPLGVHSK